MSSDKMRQLLESIDKFQLNENTQDIKSYLQAMSEYSDYFLQNGKNMSFPVNPYNKRSTKMVKGFAANMDYDQFTRMQQLYFSIYGRQKIPGFLIDLVRLAEQPDIKWDNIFWFLHPKQKISIYGIGQYEDAEFRLYGSPKGNVFLIDGESYSWADVYLGKKRARELRG